MKVTKNVPVEHWFVDFTSPGVSQRKTGRDAMSAWAALSFLATKVISNLIFIGAEERKVHELQESYSNCVCVCLVQFDTGGTSFCRERTSLRNF